MRTFGGVKWSCNLIWLCSISSRDSRRNSWDAARISTGNKCGLMVTASRNLMVCVRRVASCSKSWKCFETQCLAGKTKRFYSQYFIWTIDYKKKCRFSTYRSTFKTRMVAGELTTRSSISLMVDCSNVSSRGLLEADVAMANAAAAVDVLLLMVFNYTVIYPNDTI